ncbi:MAG: radical SAM protein [Desulfobacteraceae bacterium]|nr:radical SAM protein [Desulfobacteraceae bacterium]
MSYKYIFGPVLSRRLGISLGVDLVTHKICSLDCVYCECGKTTDLTLQRGPYVPFDAVKKELDHYWEHNQDPDYITFSGSGEPTLNQALGRVIAYIKAQKPGIRVAVLTNSTLLNDSGVRQELALADLVVPSLDAASKAAFIKANRPCKGLLVEDIIQGIQIFAKDFAGKIWLEIFILPGVNDTREELCAIRKIIVSIDPQMVQLNTLDRPGTISKILPASKAELVRVKQILDMDIIQIIAKVPDKKNIGQNRDMRSAVLETIHRRPCTRDDLIAVLNADPDKMDTLLATLETLGLIEARQEARGIFYQTNKNRAIK